MRRFAIRDHTDTLDPRHDCQEIMRLLVGREFPFDYERAMIDMVFMKGLAAPRIGGLIFSNRYIQRFPQKRYDDTAIFNPRFCQHAEAPDPAEA